MNWRCLIGRHLWQYKQNTRLPYKDNVRVCMRCKKVQGASYDGYSAPGWSTEYKELPLRPAERLPRRST